METIPSALEDVRVIDLADEKGLYCAKLLADLGADVIKIEPPGGHPTRNRGPFFHDKPHPEKSLYFFNLNTNKRSITLNVESPDGRDLFKRLVATADVVVETFPPGYLDSLGLGYEALQQVKPDLILTSITPFGQTGPYKDYKASDIVGTAMGGQMYLAGFLDRPPDRPGASQAYHQASLHAAVGTMFALYHRDLTGQGQQVDVSMQECVTLSMETAMQFFDLRGEIRRRVGERTGDRHRYTVTGLYPCKDGYMVWMVGIRGWDALVGWLAEEGVAEDLTDEKYQDPNERLRALDHIDAIFGRFVRDRSRQELYHEGQRRGIICVPVNSVADLLQDDQLLSRGYFVDVEHPELRAVLRYPGPPYRLSETPWRMGRRPPLIGEHNLEVYEKDLGISRQELARLKEMGVI